MLNLFLKNVAKTLAATAVVTAVTVSAPDAQAQQRAPTPFMPVTQPVLAEPAAPAPAQPRSTQTTFSTPYSVKASSQTQPKYATTLNPQTYPVLTEPAPTAAAPQEKSTQTIVGTPYPVKASSPDDHDPFSGSVTLNQDSFFGFYPILSGSYKINDNVAFTFYGLFWTNPGFTPSGTGGTGLWTEVGVGASFSVLDGALTINPQLGMLSGALLSGSDRSDTFDGLVAQVSLSHAGKYTEGQIYGAYYFATEAPSTNDFFHYWITAGVRPFADCKGWTQIISAGAHFEQLYRTRFEGGEASTIYTWLGPYVQFTLPNNVFLRMSAGWDLENSVSGTFYKATMGYAF